MVGTWINPRKRDTTNRFVNPFTSILLGLQAKRLVARTMVPGIPIMKSATRLRGLYEGRDEIVNVDYP